jgi:hypothetical protein
MTEAALRLRNLMKNESEYSSAETCTRVRGKVRCSFIVVGGQFSTVIYLIAYQHKSTTIISLTYEHKVIGTMYLIFNRNYQQPWLS